MQKALDSMPAQHRLSAVAHSYKTGMCRPPGMSTWVSSEYMLFKHKAYLHFLLGVHEYIYVHVHMYVHVHVCAGLVHVYTSTCGGQRTNQVSS